MNPSRSHMAHPRFCPAHWPEPLTASGAAQACPSCLPSPANQLTRQDGSRPGRPLATGNRFALRRFPIGSLTPGRPAFLPSRIRGCGALICSLCFGRLGLRPLAPPVLADAANQRNFLDPLGIARPFVPSSLVPPSRLRVKRIGGVTTSSADIDRHHSSGSLADLSGNSPRSIFSTTSAPLTLSIHAMTSTRCMRSL